MNVKASHMYLGMDYSLDQMRLFKTSLLRFLSIWMASKSMYRSFSEAEIKVVMVGHYKGVWKTTGKEFKANATHVWTLKEEKATHFFQSS